VGQILSLKEKLPFINSDSKGIRIAGNILYGAIFLMVLVAIVPSQPENTSLDHETNNITSARSVNTSMPSEASVSSAVQSYPEFGNYTFDGQDDVEVSVKNGPNVVHMMYISEIPANYGYTKDGARYTITLTGTHLRGYVDYTRDGYVIILQPRRPIMTKNDFMAVLNTFRRVK
jgi:hypothetical protein